MGIALPLFFAAVGVISALMVVINREPMRGALFLILTLFSVAAVYLFLGAEFLAAIQIIIYAGAIMVLIVFVIQLTGTHMTIAAALQKQTPLAITVSSLIFIQILLLTIRFVSNFARKEAVADLGTTLSFSKILFTKYLLPFEIASVLMLVAVFGTVLLAQRKDIRE